MIDLSALPPSLHRFVIDLLSGAVAELSEGKKATPRWLVGRFDDEPKAGLLALSDDAAKDACADGLRRLAAVIEAEFVIFIHEAWALTGRDLKRFDEIIERYGSLANYPGHVDSLAIFCECADGAFISQTRLGPDGHSKKKRKILDEVKFTWSNVVEGRFVGLLPQKGMMH